MTLDNKVCCCFFNSRTKIKHCENNKSTQSHTAASASVLQNGLSDHKSTHSHTATSASVLHNGLSDNKSTHSHTAASASVLHNGLSDHKSKTYQCDHDLCRRSHGGHDVQWSLHSHVSHLPGSSHHHGSASVHSATWWWALKNTLFLMNSFVCKNLKQNDG